MNQINDILNSTMSELETFTNSQIVLSKPIMIDNHKIITVSKVKCGYIGAENEKEEKPFFEGSAGTLSFTPLAVIVSDPNEIKLLHLEASTHTFEYIVDNTVDLIEEIINKLSNKNKDK